LNAKGRDQGRTFGKNDVLKRLNVFGRIRGIRHVWEHVDIRKGGGVLEKVIRGKRVTSTARTDLPRRKEARYPAKLFSSRAAERPQRKKKIQKEKKSGEKCDVDSCTEECSR